MKTLVNILDKASKVLTIICGAGVFFLILETIYQLLIK